jgi:plastocyanin
MVVGSLVAVVWAALVCAAAGAGGAAAPPPAVVPVGHENALPITVKTPQDLAFKAEAERQFLILNLMAGGRLAYEGGDFARAVREWETLLKVPRLPPEIAAVVGPLLAEARQKQGPAKPAERPPGDDPVPPTIPLGEPATVASILEPPHGTTVSGTVSGGGTIGPAATVLWLKRLDGPTPAPRPSRQPRVLSQAGKAFIPHVLAIPVGGSVSFRNDDPFFHNVFSPSRGNEFDAGLYRSGKTYVKTFTRPGAVELLCNIHASMVAYIYVVDSAYYTQARTGGVFTIRNVPPGHYELAAWHESSRNVIKQAITVGASGASGIAVRIPGDRPPMVNVPDKYGKLRQVQLGY